MIVSLLANKTNRSTCKFRVLMVSVLDPYISLIIPNYRLNLIIGSESKTTLTQSSG